MARNNNAILLLVGIVSSTMAFIDMPTPSIEERLGRLEAKLQLCDCANHTIPTSVAFHACLSNSLYNVGAHQQIVFDNVVTNKGSGYNNVHGHFTAPVSGMYAFFVTITNIPKHSASFQLLRNGQWIGHILAHGTDNNPSMYVTSTLAATTQLDAGGEVWVQNAYSYSTVEELDGANWSCFTGFLISVL